MLAVLLETTLVASETAVYAGTLVNLSLEMKNGHKVWSKREILQLIEKYRQSDVLWNAKLPQYKNRALKQEALSELATFFQTPTSEIQRKLHNLRCQLNSEVKKLKRRSDRSGVAFKSSWEYFDHLVFLISAEPQDDYMEEIDVSEHLETMIEAESSSYFRQDGYVDNQISDSTNVGIEIKKEPGVTDDLRQNDNRIESIAGSSRLNEVPFDVRASIKRESTDDRNNELKNGCAFKKNRLSEPSNENKDDSQIFGDFVAAELRNLRSEMNRKKLKRIILRGLLEVSESED